MSTANFPTLPLLFTEPDFHTLPPAQQFQLLYLSDAYTADRKQAQADLLQLVYTLKKLRDKANDHPDIAYMELLIKVIESNLNESSDILGNEIIHAAILPH